jgi:NitT/TauT family transport system permease protein
MNGVEPLLDLDRCRDRQARLRRHMAADRLDLVVVTTPEHVAYLTGHRWDHRFAPLAAMRSTGEVLLVCPDRPVERAAADEVRTYEAKWRSPLRNDQREAAAAVLADWLRAGPRPGRVGVEFSACPPHVVRTFDAAALADIEPELLRLRRRKDPDELALLGRAIAASGAMVARARELVAPGIDELTVFSALQEAAVAAWAIPPYILPGPALVARTMVAEWPGLRDAAWVTLGITAMALAAAVVLGVALAVVFAQSRWIEDALFPYAVVLQVTPVVAIAPLVIIWTRNDVVLALLVCAWIVAFFPILSNTTIGLRAVDRNLEDLFRLAGASRMQTLLRLRLPSALPYFFAGLRVSGGLALIGAVVAEFVAGTGGSASGLAYVILESGYRLQIPKMFAALALVSAIGIAIFLLLGLVAHLALRRWHETAGAGEDA